MHLMLSRAGLEEMVGLRGSLYSTLSFNECSNYQSNLDGRPLDVCRPLLNVAYPGEERRGTLNFLQVYTDSPHTHMTSSYKHPVSGVITTCGLMNHDTTRAIHPRAKEYVNHMEDFEAKLVKHLSCRLEQVRLFQDTDCPAFIRPKALFTASSAWQSSWLKMPCSSPILNMVEGIGILTMLQEALHFLNSMLRWTSDKNSGRGGFYKS